MDFHEFARTCRMRGLTIVFHISLYLNLVACAGNLVTPEEPLADVYFPQSPEFTGLTLNLAMGTSSITGTISVRFAQPMNPEEVASQVDWGECTLKLKLQDVHSGQCIPLRLSQVSRRNSDFQFEITGSLAASREFQFVVEPGLSDFRNKTMLNRITHKFTSPGLVDARPSVVTYTSSVTAEGKVSVDLVFDMSMELTSLEIGSGCNAYARLMMVVNGEESGNCVLPDQIVDQGLINGQHTISFDFPRVDLRAGTYVFVLDANVRSQKSIAIGTEFRKRFRPPNSPGIDDAD